MVSNKVTDMRVLKLLNAATYAWDQGEKEVAQDRVKAISELYAVAGEKPPKLLSKLVAAIAKEMKQ